MIQRISKEKLMFEELALLKGKNEGSLSNLFKVIVIDKFSRVSEPRRCFRSKDIKFSVLNSISSVVRNTKLMKLKNKEGSLQVSD